MQLYDQHLTELASFVRVVEHGTFAAAAREEGVPKSTITRRIARLEESLGVELLRRAPRSFTVSDDGQVLYQRSVNALRELGAATQSIRELADEPVGKLVVTALPDLGHMPPTADLLVECARRFPKLTIELRLEQRVVDLVREDVDVAIRPRPGGEIAGDGDLMSRRLTSIEASLFASKEFVAVHGLPTTLDLRGFPTVQHAGMRRREIVMHHAEVGTGQLQFGDPVVVLDDFNLVRSLVERGLGIGMLWDVNKIDADLVRVLPEWSMSAGELRLVWAATRHLSPRLRSFIDLAVEVFGSTK